MIYNKGQETYDKLVKFPSIPRYMLARAQAVSVKKEYQANISGKKKAVSLIKTTDINRIEESNPRRCDDRSIIKQKKAASSDEGI